MDKFLFFDCAATTQCCDAATEALRRYSAESFGNPSSRHALGLEASRAIEAARQFFGSEFGVEPAQVIFTGSGTEADNLAISGILRPILVQSLKTGSLKKPRVLCTSVEHPAVRQTCLSWIDLGFDVQLIPVGTDGSIDPKQFMDLVTPETVLISIMRVNNILGNIFPVEELARAAKEKVPSLLFHCDAIQAFTKVDCPKAGSSVDLLTLSGHKIQGPKAIGAVIVLNRSVLKQLQPVVFGGGQESGFRSGTPNPGLIAGFHAAAQEAIERNSGPKLEGLRERLERELNDRRLLRGPGNPDGPLVWLSPKSAVPYIVNLSAPGLPASVISGMLEKRGCLVSLGSACASKKSGPDPVLTAMGLSTLLTSSSIRVSFCDVMNSDDVALLAQALDESLSELKNL